MIIIGCDLHTRSEQIALQDTEAGEFEERRLEYEDGEARKFYAGLKGPALVGIESTGYTRWFAEMLAGLGHPQLDVWIQQLDRRIEQEVAQREEAQRLMTHPGVGPQTAWAAVQR